MIRVGDPGDQPHPHAPRAAGLRAGLLAGSGHALGARVAIRHVGAGILRLLAVYSPAGPERGFLDWGEGGDDRAVVAVRLDDGAEVIPFAGAALRGARGNGHAPSAA